jgi:hypothetical protein
VQSNNEAGEPLAMSNLPVKNREGMLNFQTHGIVFSNY